MESDDQVYEKEKDSDLKSDYSLTKSEKFEVEVVILQEKIVEIIDDETIKRGFKPKPEPIKP